MENICYYSPIYNTQEDTGLVDKNQLCSNFLRLLVPNEEETMFALKRCLSNDVLKIFLHTSVETESCKRVAFKYCLPEKIVTLFSAIKHPSDDDIADALNKCDAETLPQLVAKIKKPTQGQKNIAFNKGSYYNLPELFAAIKNPSNEDRRLLIIKCRSLGILRVPQLLGPMTQNERYLALIDKTSIELYNLIAKTDEDNIIALQNCNSYILINLVKAIETKMARSLTQEEKNIAMKSCSSDQIVNLFKMFKNPTEQDWINAIKYCHGQKIPELFYGAQSCTNPYLIKMAFDYCFGYSIPYLYQAISAEVYLDLAFEKCYDQSIVNLAQYINRTPEICLRAFKLCSPNNIVELFELYRDASFTNIAIEKCCTSEIPRLYQRLVTNNSEIRKKCLAYCRPDKIPELFKQFVESKSKSLDEERKLALSYCDSRNIPDLLQVFETFTKDEKELAFVKCNPTSICQLFTIFNDPDNRRERLRVLDKCDEFYIHILFAQIDNATYRERKIALERCHPRFIYIVYSNILTPIPEERVIALDRCDSNEIPYLFELFNNPTEDEKNRALELCSEYFIYQLACRMNNMSNVQYMTALNRCVKFDLIKLFKKIQSPATEDMYRVVLERCHSDDLFVVYNLFTNKFSQIVNKDIFLTRAFGNVLVAIVEQYCLTIADIDKIILKANTVSDFTRLINKIFPYIYNDKFRRLNLVRALTFAPLANFLQQPIINKIAEMFPEMTHENIKAIAHPTIEEIDIALAKLPVMKLNSRIAAGLFPFVFRDPIRRLVLQNVYPNIHIWFLDPFVLQSIKNCYPHLTQRYIAFLCTPTEKEEIEIN